MKFFFFMIMVVLMSSSYAQQIYRFTDGTPPTFKAHGESPWPNACAGGLLLPHFSNFDLNQDGSEDLLVMDRRMSKVLTFLSKEKAGKHSWVYAPQYEALIPANAHYYLQFFDIDGDGRKDLLTNDAGNSVQVYRNVSMQGTFFFERITEQLPAYDPEKDAILNVSVSNADIPAMADVDFDGDIDIVSFDSGADVYYYRNNSNQSGNPPYDLSFDIGAHCWGRFSEFSRSDSIILNAGCDWQNITGHGKAAHAGTNLLILDLDGDKDADLLISDSESPYVKALYNGRNPLSQSSHRRDSMYKYDKEFPASKPIKVPDLPIMSYLDVNHDGIKDLIASSGELKPGITQESVWLYKGLASKDSVRLSFEDSSFLRNTMLDLGMYTIPCFGDISGDGLADLLVAYIAPFGPGEIEHFQLAYFQRKNNEDNKASFILIDDDYLKLAADKSFFLYPTLGDVDGDGRIDLLLGNERGSITYFKNTADSGQASFEIQTDEFANIDVGNNSAPCLFDINGDTKLDLVVGEQQGNLNYFNQGSNGSFTLVTDSFGKVRVTLADIKVISGDTVKFYSQGRNGNSTPFIGDIDKNGKPDMMVGSDHGELFFYRDFTASKDYKFRRARRYYYSQLTGDLRNKDFGRSTPVIPAFHDMDGDGLQDLLIGGERGGLSYMRGRLVDLSVTQRSNAAVTEELEIYPNPARDLVSISLPDATSRLVEVYSITGRRILSLSTVSEKLEIEVSSWPPGIFLIKAQGAKDVLTAQVWVR